MVPGNHRLALWKPLAVSLVLTPVGLALGIMSAAGGHGSYLLTKVLFPWTMLSTVFLGSITTPFVAVAIIQYPTYGLILGLANRNARLSRALAVLISVHILLAIVSLALPNHNF